jgi:hypothetical protein
MPNTGLLRNLPILLAAIVSTSCEDSSSTIASPVEPTGTAESWRVGPPLRTPLSDLKRFACTWTSLEPIGSRTVQFDSLGVLTASRPLRTPGASPDDRYVVESRSLRLDSAMVVAIRDSLLHPAIFQAPTLVVRDPLCADGEQASYELLVSNREWVRLEDQGCHPRTPSPEGYRVVDRVARTLFEVAFPSN